MIPFLLFLFSTTPYSTYGAFCLAPHPIYFSVNGEPVREYVNVEGTEYAVDWDGKRLGIFPVNRMERFFNLPPRKDFHFDSGCLWAFGVAVIIWAWIGWIAWEFFK